MTAAILGMCLLGLSLVTGCWEPPRPDAYFDPCVNGGETGKSYSATLDEIYDTSVTDVRPPAIGSTLATCGSLDGLGLGSVLEFAVTAASERTTVCFVHRADLSLPWNLQVTGDGKRLTGDEIKGSVALFFRSVTTERCAGLLEIDFRTTHRQPFDPKSPDQDPPFLVIRTFQTQDGATCPALGGQSGPITCSDTWVATLTPR